MQQQHEDVKKQRKKSSWEADSEEIRTNVSKSRVLKVLSSPEEEEEEEEEQEEEEQHGALLEPAFAKRRG